MPERYFLCIQVLQVDLLQAEQRQNIDLQRFHQLLKGRALVGTVHGAGKIRNGQVGMFGAEANWFVLVSGFCWE